tara:strand:+ start:1066 stop:1398 length:333 start_codon:yes stop_codon:yes gene_type:complete
MWSIAIMGILCSSIIRDTAITDITISNRKSFIQNINTITSSQKNIIQSTNIIRNPTVATESTVIIIATNPGEIIEITDIGIIAIIDNSLSIHDWDMVVTKKPLSGLFFLV